MRRYLSSSLLFACVACHDASPPPSDEYLYVWAGDSAGTSSDFLGVIDASPSSPTYGAVVAPCRLVSRARTHIIPRRC
jgi:hypothetical protein